MITIEITCDEKWQKAMEASREHYDETLPKCLWRLMNWMHAYSRIKTVRISSDFGEHCFLFRAINEDGSVSICGGIIFHGFKGEGYQENGSVSLSPSYGWQIHT